MAGITITIDQKQLRDMTDALGNVLKDNPEKSKRMKEVLEKAVQPAFRRLFETTPVGPTGNLRAARDYKIVQYPLDGVAVAIIGYRRAGREPSASAAGGSVRKGKDRAFHQWWLENGTNERVINKIADKPYRRRAHQRTMKSGVVAMIREHQVARQGGYIASSFNKLGGFEGFVPTPRMPRGSGTPQRVQTRPAYPGAFFKKSSQPIRIPPMLPGGRVGQPPLQTAYDTSRQQVAEILQRELRLTLEEAIQQVALSAQVSAG